MREGSKERLYREEEVAEILQRAVGLERRRQQEQPALSLAEIEVIARESGIEPSLVRQAARELELQKSSGLATRLLGAPPTRTVERLVEGELTQELHELVATDIREALGTVVMMGQVSTVGRALTWTGFGSSGAIEVHVSPRDGQTLIRIDSNSKNVAGGLFGGIIGGVGGGLGSNVAWLVPRFLGLPWVAGLLAAAGVIGGAYALARLIYGSAVGRVHRKMDQLADTLEGHVRERLLAKNALGG
jgi:hypothetical protein